MYAKYPHPGPIERAVRLVMSRQLPVGSSLSPSKSRVALELTCFFVQDGSWAQEAIGGMTNRTIAMSYPNFRFSFTIWMLGKADGYLKQLEAKGRG